MNLIILSRFGENDSLLVKTISELINIDNENIQLRSKLRRRLIEAYSNQTLNRLDNRAQGHLAKKVSQGKFSNWIRGRRGRVSFLLESSTN